MDTHYNYYNVTFTADWGSLVITVFATDGESAVDVARDRAHHDGDIPWDVICMMPHVEVEYAGPYAGWSD